jgi:hypothetical protein
LRVAPATTGPLIIAAILRSKLFWLAHAWINVPSTEKCSLDSRPRSSAKRMTSAKKPSTT